MNQKSMLMTLIIIIYQRYCSTFPFFCFLLLIFYWHFFVSFILHLMFGLYTWTDFDAYSVIGCYYHERFDFGFLYFYGRLENDCKNLWYSMNDSIYEMGPQCMTAFISGESNHLTIWTNVSKMLSTFNWLCRTVVHKGVWNQNSRKKKYFEMVTACFYIARQFHMFPHFQRLQVFYCCVHHCCAITFSDIFICIYT